MLSKEIYQKRSITGSAFTPSFSEIPVRSAPPIPRHVSTRRPPPSPPTSTQESAAVLNWAESPEAPKPKPRAAERDSPAEDHAE